MQLPRTRFLLRRLPGTGQKVAQHGGGGAHNNNGASLQALMPMIAQTGLRSLHTSSSYVGIAQQLVPQHLGGGVLRRSSSSSTSVPIEPIASWHSSTPSTTAAPSIAAAETISQKENPPSTSTFHKVPQAQALKSLKPYWVLSKGKLTIWVALSALPGYFVASPVLCPLELGALILGTTALSASSQAMNQLLERDYDRLMRRTRTRPLVTGAIAVPEARNFILASGALGLGSLAALNPLTALVGATTWSTYVAGYTPMKRWTPYNTHVGAVVGSLPTMLGFSAVCGTAGALASPWLPHAGFVFGLQTLWQMPHFYSLAWLYRSDYTSGGYKMFCLDDATGHTTARMCLPYMAAISVAPVLAYSADLASVMFLVDGTMVNLFWLRMYAQFYQSPSTHTCRRFFLASMAHLLFILAFFSLHARSRDELGESVYPAWRREAQTWVMHHLCVHEKLKDDPAMCPPSDMFASPSSPER